MIKGKRKSVRIVNAVFDYRTKKSNRWSFTHKAAGLRGFIYIDKTKPPPRELQILFPNNNPGKEDSA